MLYKFKSKNTGDVIMLEPHGRQVLELSLIHISEPTRQADSVRLAAEPGRQVWGRLRC